MPTLIPALLLLVACATDDPGKTADSEPLEPICGDRTCQPCEMREGRYSISECDTACGLVWSCGNAPPKGGPCPDAPSVWMYQSKKCECVTEDGRWNTADPGCVPDPYGE